MKRRILVAILAITALSILLFAVPLGVLVERFVDQEATLRLERQAILAGRAVPADYATDNDPVELPAGEDGALLALYDMSGDLVVGDGPTHADQTTVNALSNGVADDERRDSRVVAVPVTADERVVGAIRAQQPTSGSNARSVRLICLIVGLAIVVFGLGALIAVIVSRDLARPVLQLTEAVVSLGQGSFDARPLATGVPELDAASAALMTTSQRLEDVMTRERAFSSDASHQLRTPVAGLRAAIETELAFPRDDSTQVLREALQDIDRLEQTITELLTLARAATVPVTANLDVATVLRGAERRWHGPLASAGRPLRIDTECQCSGVIGDEVLLGHALDVVLDNALVHGQGVVRVGLVVSPPAVVISVSDEGPGFDSDSDGDARIESCEPTDVVADTVVSGYGLGEDFGADSAVHGLGLALADRLLGRMSARLVIARRGPRPQVDLVLRRLADSPNAS
ncbi:MAG: HAMP domain-containing histidine kinase [Actinobacteria bacterium]|nr:HAMP domain-containing histidine kinase [Actinomycetota bacterium]